MPVCKNSSKRYYTGKEPSPKGLGWCAHAEKEGKRRKGRDGNMWVVAKVSNSLKWIRTKTTPAKRKKSSNQITASNPVTVSSKCIPKPGDKIVTEIHMPLMCYAEDGNTIVYAKNVKTKLKDKTVLTYLHSRKFSNYIQGIFDRMPIPRGALWWSHNLVPMYIPKIQSIQASVNSDRIFHVRIEAVLSKTASKNLTERDKVVNLTMEQYEEAIRETFGHWRTASSILDTKFDKYESLPRLQFEDKDIHIQCFCS